MNSISRTLLLIRHAQTLHIQHGKSDKTRELKSEGIREAHLAGNFLKKLDLNAFKFYSSTAKRAMDTAGIIASYLEYPQESIILEEDIYSGSLHDVLTHIRQTEETFNSIILVGHHPTLEETHDYISKDKKKVMSTCEIIGIEIATKWNKITRESGNTILQFHPSQLASHGTI